MLRPLVLLLDKVDLLDDQEEEVETWDTARAWCCTTWVPLDFKNVRHCSYWIRL